MRNNSVRKKIFYQIPVLLLILAISVPMVTAPVLSTILSSSTNVPVNQLAYATTEGDGGGDSGGGDSGGGDSGGGDSGGGDSGGGDSGGGDSGGGDSGGGDSGGGDSGGGDQSSSSTTTTDPALASSTTTTDPALASSTTTTDPALASSTTTIDPALGQSPMGLTFSTENASPSLTDETEEQDLDCEDVSNKNFKVSSNDPNGFDRDNDGIGCESDDEDNNDGNNDIPPIGVTNEGPDNDCLMNPDLPKCAYVDGDCPDGFFNNDDDQCVPEGGCPDGYHTVDDDETGRCIPDSDGCPDGMIFRSDGKTCGSEENVCEDSPELEKCVNTSCDPSYPDFCISPNQRGLNCDNHNGKVEPNEIFKYNFKVKQPDTQDFDRDGNGIGCEYGNGNNNSGNDGNDGNGNNNSGNDGNDGNDGNGNDGNGNDDDGNGGDQYIIKASNSCADISDTVDLSSEQLDPQEVRTIAYFGNCDLDTASLQLNLIQNEDLKLVAAHLDDGLSDAVEVDMTQIGQSGSNSNTLYAATITDNQEGHDVDTGETKTLNNINGIVLWNDGEDESIEFDDNNFVEANINFFN
ncbi:hypothetical protein [Candidatus Nitrosocosmicus oleophilus]|nr:hypothetical protein [Candidatus Nitrosocosmicus oleophilus]